jgi:hypothetical protein
MANKREAADESGPEPVKITNTQASVFDNLIGVYGSTRGDVMSTLIQLGMQHLRGARTLTEVMNEAKLLKNDAPPDLVKTRGKKEAQE